ncbi:MAG: sensor histidine kinase [Thermodesulfovibrionales bacterium]
MSIRLKLTIMFLVFVLVPSLFVGALTFTNYKDSIETLRIANLQDITAFKADKIESYFAGLKANIEVAQGYYNIKQNLPVLTRLAKAPNSPAFLFAKKALDEQLQHMQSVLALSDIMLVDPMGRVVFSSNPRHSLKDFLNRLPDQTQQAFAEGKEKVYFSDVFFDKGQDNKPSMLITAPAVGFDGTFIGVIAFEVDMSSIYTIIQDTTGLGNTGEVLLGKKTDKEVIFLNPLRHDPDAALKKAVSLGGELGGPVQKAVQGKNGTGRLTDYRGRQVITAWRYIPSLDWGMVAKIDVEEAFANVINLRRLVIMILSIVFVLCGIIAFSIAQSISAPIQTLSKGAEAVGGGNLDYKVGTDQKDEIGHLSRAFDKMTGDLKKITASRDELNNEINERRQAEKKISSLNEELKHHVLQLEAANRELEAFSYSVSHDLRAPLRSVAGFSQVLFEDYADKLDAEGRDSLQRILNATHRMGRLIDDLLNLSRVSRSEMRREKVNLSELAGKIAQDLRMTRPERQAEFIISEGLVARGDEPLLTVVLENLFGNAWKFTGKNLRTVIEFGVAQHEGGQTFFVKDNGVGFDMSYAGKMFSPFQRLHSTTEFPGTGIGLATVKRIINRHGGDVWIEAVAGKGTTVYFTL